MKRLLTLLACLAILISTFGASAFAQEEGELQPLVPAPSAETGEWVNETPSLWFVELSSAPSVDGTSAAVLKAERAAFQKAAKNAGLKYTERFAFSNLWNGLSIQVEPGEISKLSRIPGVKNIYPVEVISLPETTLSEPELFTALNMTGAAAAQSELGLTGMGIKVAVMDTGVDIDHPAFGGDGVHNNTPVFPTARIAYGYDFVGDAFNADSTSAAYNPVPVPDPIPDDCNGHGTHVAGIIGADDATNGMKGVAPAVTFGAYRVFGCAGSTTADIMIAAMERALADDMDVLNMSIGSAFQWPQYPTAKAADKLVNAGMVVVASIGNSGANGLYSAGAPGLGEKVIGVASFDNSHLLLPYFIVNDRNIGYMPMTFSVPAPLSGSSEIVYVGQGCNTDPLLADPAGKTAMVVRGVCPFSEKALKAINAGATAVVVYNNVPGVVAGTLGAPLPYNVPVVGISQADGLFIRAQAAPVFMTWTDQTASFPSPTDGQISSFSSYGLSPDLALKPDIGAPGGNIYSAYPLENGAYATLSGTSMASPHVAGSAALLLEARPNTPSQAVRGILQNSADPKYWWGIPTGPYLDMVHRQGAGMLDIYNAVLSTTKIEPAKLSLGESEFGPATRTLWIENNSPYPVTYDLSHTPALSTGPNTFTVGAFTGYAAVAFSAPSVTVPAGGSASVDVTITANSTLDPLSQYGGYVVFTPQGGGEKYRVPYAGLKGDYQAKVVLPTGGLFPALGWSPNGSSFGLADAGDVFTMVGFDMPYLLVHFDHQSRLFRVEIFDAKGKSWQRAYNEDYMGRNSTAGGFFAFPIDGTTIGGNKVYTLPDGAYTAKISVLKALGDADNPAHWETWTSPVFIIDRP